MCVLHVSGITCMELCVLCVELLSGTCVACV